MEIFRTFNYLQHNFILPPANEVCEGYVFTGVCLSSGKGACVVGGLCVRGCTHGRSVRMQGGMHGRESVCGRVCMAGGGGGAYVAGETATATDSTHPTGMHSCYQTNVQVHQI